MVVVGPSHGQIVNKVHNVSVSEITLKDWTNEKLAYKIGNSKATSDQALFQIFDGYHTLNFLLDITIRKQVMHHIHTQYLFLSLKVFFHSLYICMSDWITDFKNVIFKGDKNIDFIGLQEDILPMILQNNMGHVIKGQMLQLTSELLSAKVMDTTNAPSDDIIFTLSPPVNNPKEGLLLFY